MDAGSSDQSAGAKKVIGRPFPKGVSGNPSGRAKASFEFRDLCREASPRMFDALIKLAEAGSSDAAKTILAYAWGKPTDKVELTGSDGGPVAIDWTKASDEELRSARDLLYKLTSRSK